MKINKQKGGVTLILLIISILVIIGFVIYILEQDKTIGPGGVEPEHGSISFSTTSAKKDIKQGNVYGIISENATGIIKSVYTKNNKNYMDIDYVELIKCESESSCPNGNTRISNINPRVRTFEIPWDVNITIQDKSNLDLINFKKIFSNDNDYRKFGLWNVLIQNDLVVNVTENFRP
jgi:hypothetical protein